MIKFSTFPTMAAAVAVVMSLAPLSASADVVPIAVAAGTRAAVKTHAGTGSARFDWLKGRNPAPVVQVAASNAPGTGSWICSPAGFGSKSKCYKR